jgi:hypothetical protein
VFQNKQRVILFPKKGLRSIKGRLILIGVLMLCLFLVACPRSNLNSKAKSKPHHWEKQRGTVVLSSTNRPVSFTTVLAIWKGKYEKKSGGTQPICYHIEVAKTDKEGKFTISSWNQDYDTSYIQNKSASLILYKPGYWAEQLEHQQPSDGNNIYHIEQISRANKQRSSKHRLNYLQRLVSKTSCDLRGDGRYKLRQVYFDILKEASQVAKTQNDKKKLASLKVWTSFVDK